MVIAPLSTCGLLLSSLAVDVLGCQSDCVFVLLQKGNTALIYASWKGHAKVVQMLLLAGVNKDAADIVGCRGVGHTLNDVFSVVLIIRGSHTGLWLISISFYCRMA